MTYALTWLPDVLLAAGLKVAQTPDWQTRGRGPMGTVRGVMCHHTATGAAGNMPSLHLLINGRPDLPGPLAQLGLGRDGTFYVIAAGRANHAGPGRWEDVTGNASFIGIEAENDGRGQPWPDVQIDAYQRGAAAILRKIGAGAGMCCGHKEYAEPAGRKIDPEGIDMALFRRGVGAFLSGKSPPKPIPAADAARRPTLRRGSKGAAVEGAQALLLIKADGFFGPDTEAALRAFQRENGLVPDGILGPESWGALRRPRAAPATPGSATFAGLPAPDTPERKPGVDGRTAVGPDGKPFALVKAPGFYTIGRTPLSSWLAQGPTLPEGGSKAVRNVLAAMSAVEGGLEAVNSYDDAHLSFGIFQWTMGAGDGEGELPALLARLKEADPAGFAECFGRYGLDAVPGQGAFTGLVSLDGAPVKTAAAKERLRGVEWAYRFWRAGHLESLRTCQFALAAARIERFRAAETHGKALQEWMSSEFAMALMLDEHVNRPGHVPGTLGQAIAARGVQAADPRGWTDSDEEGLIAAYLSRREKTDMMDSTGRATRIEHAVLGGTLSAKRGSFHPSA